VSEAVVFPVCAVLSGVSPPLHPARDTRIKAVIVMLRIGCPPVGLIRPRSTYLNSLSLSALRRDRFHCWHRRAPRRLPAAPQRASRDPRLVEHSHARFERQLDEPSLAAQDVAATGGIAREFEFAGVREKRGLTRQRVAQPDPEPLGLGDTPEGLPSETGPSKDQRGTTRKLADLLTPRVLGPRSAQAVPGAALARDLLHFQRLAFADFRGCSPRVTSTLRARLANSSRSGPRAPACRRSTGES
jgi:hypothetical protein